MKLSTRQITRLLKSYRHFGDEGLISKKRGRPSHHQLDPHTKQRALELLQTRYADFGPTFAHEKLTEVHHLVLGRETVRRLMIQAGVWHPRRARKPVLHPLRERRARVGELVQIDGSPYAWFEDRAPACSLLVFIDDATGRLLALHFTEAESTFSYFEAAENYFRRLGKPLAFYSDKNETRYIDPIRQAGEEAQAPRPITRSSVAALPHSPQDSTTKSAKVTFLFGTNRTRCAWCR